MCKRAMLVLSVGRMGACAEYPRLHATAHMHADLYAACAGSMANVFMMLRRWLQVLRYLIPWHASTEAYACMYVVHVGI